MMAPVITDFSGCLHQNIFRWRKTEIFQLAAERSARNAELNRGLAAMTGADGGGSGAMMTLRAPTLAIAFVLILAGYSIWDLDQLSGRRYGLTAVTVPLAARPAPVPAAALLAPAVTIGGRVTMGVAMMFLLIVAH